MKFKNSFQLRYLFSFVLILFVPMLCLLLYMYYSVRGNLEKDTVNLNWANLSQVNSVVDNNIQRLEKLSLLIRENPNLKPYFLELSDFNYYLAVEALKDIVSTNDLISVISVYNTTGDLIASNCGTTPREYWGSIVLPVQLDNGNSIKDYIAKVKEPIHTMGYVTIPNVGKERCMLYFYPIAISGDRTTSVLVMAIMEQNIINLFKEQYNGMASALMIYDQNEKQITQYNATHAMNEAWRSYQQQSQQLRNGSALYTYQNQKYCVSVITSFKTGWEYVSMVPLSIVSMELQNNLKTFSILYVMLILFSGFGIYFALRFNYTPLLKLKREMEPIVAVGGLDELETIRTAVGMLKTNLDKMTVRISNTRPTIRNYLLQQILWGKITHPEVLREFGEESELNFRYGGFVVGIFSAMGDGEKIASAITGQLQNTVDVYAVDMGEGDKQYLLLNMAADHFAEEQKKFKLIVERFNEQNDSHICIMLGRVYGFPLISRSRFEAAIAGKFCKYEDSKPAMYSFYQVLSDNTSIPNGFSSGYIKDFELAILRSDVEYLAKFPGLMLREISRSKLPHYYGNYLLYDIARVITANFSDKLQKFDFLENLWTLIYSESRNPSMEDLDEAFTFICSSTIQCLQTVSNGDSWQINQIMKFIDENFCKPDFSIQLVAEKFDMSPSWLSHYFKSNAYVTVTEYVQNKRMKYAKERLDKGCSVNELSEQLGYFNLSSFIRSFKKSVGMTPKQYQERNHENP